MAHFKYLAHTFLDKNVNLAKRVRLDTVNKKWYTNVNTVSTALR